MIEFEIIFRNEDRINYYELPYEGVQFEFKNDEGEVEFREPNRDEAIGALINDIIQKRYIKCLELGSKKSVFINTELIKVFSIHD